MSPSFQYTFCLYSLPDLCVDHARFRLVVEVRVRPGAFSEHGDHYKRPGKHVQNPNQDPPTGCFGTLTNGFWVPVVLDG